LNFRNKLVLINLFLLIVFSTILVQTRSILKKQIQNEQQLSFEKTQTILKDTFDGFIHGLQGAAGVALVTNFKPSLKQFRDYAISRNNFNNFPGALGFGLIRYIPNNAIEKYTKQASKEGIKVKHFESRFAQNQKDFMIIERIEPLSKNQQALGLDVGGEESRREAAWAAAITNRPTLTRSIQLVQVDKTEPGFLFYLPIYKSYPPPEHKLERIQSLIGWAYTPLTKSVLADGIADKIDNRLFITISDESSASERYILFSNSQKQNISTRKADFETTLNVGGRNWTLRGFPNNDFKVTLVTLLPWLMASIGFLLSSFGIYKILNLAEQNTAAIHRAYKAENWNNNVLDASSYSIIATDCEGSIITFNHAAEVMLGYTADEVIGKMTPQKIHLEEEVVQRAKELSNELCRPIPPGFEVFTAKARFSSDTNEWTYVRKNGTHFPVRLCVTSLKDQKGEIIGFLGVAEDLSEQKKMLSVIESQRAQIFNSAKMSSLGEMAGGIAHEINNPLATINSVVFLIKQIDKTGKLKKEILDEQLTKIERTVERIAKIITGLKTFSRQSDDDPKTLESVSDLIANTLELCHSRFKSRGISLELFIESDSKVLCRPTQLSQVLMNILGNAFDAVESTKNPWVKINVNESSNRVIISITDSGNGISPSIAKKIMQPFYTTKEVGKGTGLGLSISTSIIKDHDGVMTYDEKSENTRFIVDLPKA
jgi:PAS domain S-box-containing protein